MSADAGPPSGPPDEPHPADALPPGVPPPPLLGTPAADDVDLFSPRTEPIDLRGATDGPGRWPVERGPLPAPPPVPPAPPADPPARRRIGTLRFAAAAAALLALVGVGTAVTLLRPAGDAPASASATGTPAPVAPAAVSLGPSTSLPVTTSAPTTGPTTASPSATTSAPTTPATPTSTRPTSTASTPAASTPARTTSRTTTTTSRTTTTTKAAPATRSYSASVAAAKDTVAGVAVSAGSSISVRASGSIVGGYFAVDSCTGQNEFSPTGARSVTGASGPCKLLFDANESVLPGAPIGALLVRVGTGGWSLAGASRSFTAASGGTVAFTVNDLKRSDNSGAFSVTYSVTSPA
jgi:hypothetical protein